MSMRKFTIAIIFILLLAFFFPLTASADMGPKDSLRVYVENPPNEEYYLDLLTQKTRPYDNFYDDERKYDTHMLSLLYRYADEGWKPAFTEGTGLPLGGDLIGKSVDNRMLHEFGYYGLPDTYRIIIVTQSGEIAVSDAYTRAALQSSITYDYATGKATVPSVFVTYLIQFATTFLLTILIEGVILLLFRINLRENWKAFLITNLITQILLTFTVGIALIKGGTIGAYIVQFPVEIVIVIAETLVFRHFFKGVSGKRKVAYGITANLVSWLVGFLLISGMFTFLTKIL